MTYFTDSFSELFSESLNVSFADLLTDSFSELLTESVNDSFTRFFIIHLIIVMSNYTHTNKGLNLEPLKNLHFVPVEEPFKVLFRRVP